MFGNLVQRLQTFSPLASPVASPVASPKMAARRRYAKTPAQRRSLKEEFREVQSDPEEASDKIKSRSKRRVDKLRGRRLDVSAPQLQGSKSMGRLDGIKQVQRLAQYEHYFQALLNESRQEHCDHEDIARAKAKAKQAVKRGEEESDLERIQDLFPNDYLRLYDKDVLTMRMKGLMRKRSSPAARLQRALSAKSLRPESPPPRPAPDPRHDKRHFIMEAPVQFSTGVQSQDRHLFLFNDLLLVAKARSGGNFKLKEKVRVSELWLTRASLDDVSELNRSPDTSFVVGWPTTNVVATFSTQAARDLWWSKLTEVLSTERHREPSATNIQVVYYDLGTTIEYCKTFSVGPDESARSCVKTALDHLEMGALDPGHFQLWAKTARDEAPYPLVGHERPFAIKLSCLRDGLSSEEGFDLDHCNNLHDPLARCHFILRNTYKGSESEKKCAKKSVGRMRIGQVFRRSLSKESTGCLFGLPLGKVCDGDSLPRPVMEMLQQVFAKGPFTQGIFRKSANARLVRELREKLDSGEAVSLERVPVLATAALLKDFLRSLPDPLLGAEFYPQWRAAIDTPSPQHKLLRIKAVVTQLPKVNYTLLTHFLCVLHHIARRSAHNLMSAGNLAVCVGPSLLWSEGGGGGVGDDLRAVPALVEALVTHCELLCGSHVPHLLGDPRDSGTEESDSMRRDDSSIDSLECSPPPRKDKMSLSRDSGLTMSDSQLYTPDEEESASTGSSGYDPAFDPHTKVTPSLSVPVEYVRVYGGWEERLNPNFQRQAWFRQRSRRINSVSTPSKPEDVRRSASEESLLEAPPPTPPRRNKPEPPPPASSELRDNDVEEKFGRHPPLRKVTAVQCEVVSDPVGPKQLIRVTVNAPNAVRKLSLSSAELSYSPGSGNLKAIRNETITEQKFSPRKERPEKRTSEQHNRLGDSSAMDQTHAQQNGKDEYYKTREECEDSSTLSDDDCTPHVSRSNSRGNEVTPKLRHLPPVHVESCFVRGRLKRKEERAAHRSRSLPPPPPYRPPPPATSRRAPITSYYLGDCSQTQHYVVTRTFLDEESYV